MDVGPASDGCPLSLPAQPLPSSSGDRTFLPRRITKHVVGGGDASSQLGDTSRVQITASPALVPATGSGISQEGQRGRGCTRRGPGALSSLSPLSTPRAPNAKPIPFQQTRKCSPNAHLWNTDAGAGGWRLPQFLPAGSAGDKGGGTAPRSPRLTVQNTSRLSAAHTPHRARS